MPRKKKEPAKKKYSQKTISYTMPPDVVESIEKIMSTYGEKTMSKTIGMCVLNFHSQRERIKELQDELYKVKATFSSNKQNVRNFVSAFHNLLNQVDPTNDNQVDENTFEEDFDDDDDEDE